MKELTKRQEQVLRFIAKMVKTEHLPPTLAEISEELGASSRNTAVKHLAALQKKGYIKWGVRARGIQLLEPMGLLDREDELSLPLVGAVTAGLPMLAEENIERYVPVPRLLVRSLGTHFMLRVKGDSMKNVGILDGDLVIVRSGSSAQVGDVVVALIEDDATVKRLMMSDGKRYLKPENPDFPEIHPDGDWMVQGKVVGLIREKVG